MTEGKKTGVLEICEQLHWKAPDRIFVPVGDGCIIGSVHKGLKDLMALGWIDQMPKIMGVQAEGSAPLVDAWERGLEGWEMEPVAAHSVADSIVAGLPRDRNKALAAVRETGGAYIAVSDEAILDAIPTIAQNTGVFSEPAAAASYAGLVKAVDQGLVDPDERIVVMLTGSGLKDIDATMKTVPEPPVIAPSLDAVKAVIK
jgi:threonine synthase